MHEIISIEYYENDTGKCPYLEWEEKLTTDLRAQIRRKFNNIRLGNYGDA
jgi:putative component of toxin-antitoxin plasmid stabilization module